MLLLATPIHPTLITHEAVDSIMLPYCEDLIAAKKDIQHNKHVEDPFSELVELPQPSSQSTPEERENAEWYVEEMNEGVDHYMFPRSMGYLVLESQYKK